MGTMWPEQLCRCFFKATPPTGVLVAHAYIAWSSHSKACQKYMAHGTQCATSAAQPLLHTAQRSASPCSSLPTNTSHIHFFYASMSTAASWGCPNPILVCCCCMCMTSDAPFCTSPTAMNPSDGPPIMASVWAGAWAWAVPGTASTGSNSTGNRVTRGLSARMLRDSLHEHPGVKFESMIYGFHLTICQPAPCTAWYKRNRSLQGHSTNKLTRADRAGCIAATRSPNKHLRCAELCSYAMRQEKAATLKITVSAGCLAAEYRIPVSLAEDAQLTHRSMIGCSGGVSRSSSSQYSLLM